MSRGLDAIVRKVIVEPARSVEVQAPDVLVGYDAEGVPGGFRNPDRRARFGPHDLLIEADHQFQLAGEDGEDVEALRLPLVDVRWRPRSCRNDLLEQRENWAAKDSVISYV